MKSYRNLLTAAIWAVIVALMVIAPVQSLVTQTGWWDSCPGPPICPTPYPIQPTYTPRPMPTCLPTPVCPPNPSPTPYPTATAYPPQPTFSPPSTGEPSPTIPSPTNTSLPPTPSPISTPTLQPTPTGQIYYVAPNGSDSNPGTKSQPFRTISKGATVARAGDTVYVSTGTYVEDRVTIQHSGTEGAPITLRNAPGASPVLKGAFRINDKDYIHIIGFEVDADTTQWAAIYIKGGSEHCLVENCSVHDTRGDCYYAIAVETAHYNVIRNNTIYHNIGGLDLTHGATYNTFEDNYCYENDKAGGNSDGIHLDATATRYNIIKGNVCENNSDDGIDTWTSPYNLIVGNICFDNGYDRHGNPSGNGIGIKLGSGHTGSGGNLVIDNITYDNRYDGFNTNGGQIANTLFNNTAYNNGDDGFQEWNNSGCSTFRNNIGYQNDDDNCQWPSDTTSDHNLCSGNPLFMDVANSNFHLAQGSPAIDTGATLVASDIPDVFLIGVPNFFRDEVLKWLTCDFDGIRRPQGADYDIGAYEF